MKVVPQEAFDLYKTTVTTYSASTGPLEITVFEYTGERVYASTSGADSRRFETIEIKLDGEVILPKKEYLGQEQPSCNPKSLERAIQIINGHLQ